MADKAKLPRLESRAYETYSPDVPRRAGRSVTGGLAIQDQRTGIVMPAFETRITQHMHRRAGRRADRDLNGKVVNVSALYADYLSRLDGKAQATLATHQDRALDRARPQLVLGGVPAYSASGKLPESLQGVVGKVTDLLQDKEPLYLRAQDILQTAHKGGLQRTARGSGKQAVGDLYTPLLNGLRGAQDHQGALRDGGLAPCNAAPNRPPGLALSIAMPELRLPPPSRAAPATHLPDATATPAPSRPPPPTPQPARPSGPRLMR